MRSKKLTWFLIISPPVCLVASLIIFPALQFWAANAVSQGGSNGVMIFARVIRSVVGLFGIYGVAGLFTALPIGVFLLVKNGGESTETQQPQQQHQGTTLQPYVAPTCSPDDDFVRGASFSAFMLPLVFIIGNKLWKHLFIFLGIIVAPILAILFGSLFTGTLTGTFFAIVLAFLSMVVPIIGVLVLSIYLCVVGRRRSWGDGGKWKSIDAFRNRQKTIFWVTIVLTILIGVGLILRSTQKEDLKPSESAVVEEALESLANLNPEVDTVEITQDVPVVLLEEDMKKTLEVNVGLRANVMVDKDGDGLLFYQEMTLGTDVEKKDTDGDGHEDFNELKNGYNPTVKGEKFSSITNADVVGVWSIDIGEVTSIEIRNDGIAILTLEEEGKKMTHPIFWEIRNNVLWFAVSTEELSTNYGRSSFVVMEKKSDGMIMKIMTGNGMFEYKKKTSEATL